MLISTISLTLLLASPPWCCSCLFDLSFLLCAFCSVLHFLLHARVLLATMDTLHKRTATPKDNDFDMIGEESSLSSPPSSGRAMVAHAEDTYRPYAEHGPPIDNKHGEDDYEDHNKFQSNLWWSRVRHHIRDPAAEFLGTFTMIIFGDGSVAQVMLSANPKLPESSQNKGEYQSISWG